jgi:MarR family transcriptional regulator for hemolysin
MGMGRAAMGSLVDSLEARGLVERQPKPGDRRVWLVAATGQGEDVSKKITKIDESLRAEFRAGISRKERRELAQLLNRLADNVSNVVAD